MYVHCDAVSSELNHYLTRSLSYVYEGAPFSNVALRIRCVLVRKEATERASQDGQERGQPSQMIYNTWLFLLGSSAQVGSQI